MIKLIGDTPVSSVDRFDTVLADWLDLRNMLLVAQCVVAPALARTESRGAHQRDDHPGMDESWTANQLVAFDGAQLHLKRNALSAKKDAA
jgi:succinate dehydrogenase/fumarate reductase flavoprotein subunit